MKLTRKIYLLAMCGFLAATPLLAQQNNPPITNNPIVSESYDPIVAALDSLVTLNHVVRFNGLETNCFDSPNGKCAVGPTFSDEVYADRINKINSPIPLSYNQYVKGFIDLYANRKRGLTQRAMGLSNLYFPMYEEVMDREGIPLEFKYLSIVESALNPIAVSRVGATGLWQFMYNTGIIYDLKVNSFTDERRDPYKATEAACQYFKDMYKIYGDWLLVIASYNCGAGNVNKAIKRSGGKRNFWEIMPYLPAETRGYVPAFIAVTYVMNYSREHNLYPITPAYSYFEVDTIHVNDQVTFAALANQLDLPQDVISFLNPIYKRNVIPGSNSYALRLPSRYISQFMAKEGEIYAQSTYGPKPVLPEYASRKHGDDDLLADNENSGSGIRYETTTKRIKKTHIVKRGETLASIANRYDCSAQELKKSNKLHSTKVKSGQRLQVFTYVKTKVAVKMPIATVVVKKDSGLTANATSKKDSGQTNNASDVKAKSDSTQEIAKDADDSTQERTASVVKTHNKDKGQKYIYHLVQPGDTLWNIAKRYEGLTVEMIKDMNNLHNTNLKPGTRLKVIVNG